MIDLLHSIVTSNGFIAFIVLGQFVAFFLVFFDDEFMSVMFTQANERDSAYRAANPGQRVTAHTVSPEALEFGIMFTLGWITVFTYWWERRKLVN